MGQIIFYFGQKRNSFWAKMISILRQNAFHFAAKCIPFCGKMEMRRVNKNCVPALVRSFCVLETFVIIYFTFSTMALKASGLLRARSASTLRLISIPALASAPMRRE